ncbi:MAG: phosphoribosylanthranilate isomerase [Armatimonadetes bacterium]|nr:phosphoribosylanthranilate isomerase [Armatimonadota bacterium]
MTRVKICGVARAEDAEAAAEAGADAVGFVFEPGSPRYVGRSTDLHLALPPYVVSVAVFGPFLPDAGATGFDRIQYLSGSPTGRLIRAFRLGETPLAEIVAHRSSPILIDAFHSEQFGGTGERADWEAVAQIVRSASVPVILAGGLTPDNVAEAIRIVRPYAVDVSSGVEASPGVKDHAQIRDFIAAARS